MYYVIYIYIDIHINIYFFFIYIYTYIHIQFGKTFLAWKLTGVSSSEGSQGQGAAEKSMDSIGVWGIKEEA